MLPDRRRDYPLLLLALSVFDASANPALSPGVMPGAAAPGVAASTGSCCIGTPLIEGDIAAVMLGSCALVIVAACCVVFALVHRSRPDARTRGWRLADALSEDVQFIDEHGRSVTLLVASASRLIAMLGLIVIVALYVGIGLLTLHAFAVGRAAPCVIDTMLKFLAGGAGLFLPYLANQLRAGLEKKSAALAVPPTTNAGRTTPPPLPDVPVGPKV